MWMALFFGLYIPWGVVGGAEIGSLCEARWWCGGCGMVGGKVCLVWVV